MLDRGYLMTLFILLAFMKDVDDTTVVLQIDVPGECNTYIEHVYN